jgi:hypothetical protein
MQGRPKIQDQRQHTGRPTALSTHRNETASKGRHRPRSTGGAPAEEVVELVAGECGVAVEDDERALVGVGLARVLLRHAEVDVNRALPQHEALRARTAGTVSAVYSYTDSHTVVNVIIHLTPLRAATEKVLALF